ncbi:ketopantoate reductase family protein [Paramicrobacterium chengjingii]|uniref:Ketopantoate reductase family protein n=1 Tax=Paramicrobacterium chengjingii TaxID=2769067 RepID=A0ABX6YM22_9MICO|nr:ketopantoate reductase family protein [Microbacterium chengjingii]QPZ39377.1 ketopantoate reductase family protein [Microbacterium chengjingii]
MKILVYGAGVLGSLYAARLHDAGHDVSLLARGDRLASLRKRGVLLAENESTSVRQVPVSAVESPAGKYDLILVLVRSHQVDSVLEQLVESDGDVLFLVNWAGGPEPLAEAIGRERVLLGFGNQGGTMDGDIVRYGRRTLLTRLVHMPIGEIDGQTTPRVERIVRMFRSAGFTGKAEPRMDAWLKTHAAFEVPLAHAVHTAGDPNALAGNRASLRDMVRLIRQNLEALPMRPVPRAFGALRVLPHGVLIALFRLLLRSSAAAPLGTTSPAALGELNLLAEQVDGLARRR